jgi:hypothetical protein
MTIDEEIEHDILMFRDYEIKSIPHENSNIYDDTKDLKDFIKSAEPFQLLLIHRKNKNCKELIGNWIVIIKYFIKMDDIKLFPVQGLVIKLPVEMSEDKVTNYIKPLFDDVENIISKNNLIN